VPVPTQGPLAAPTMGNLLLPAIEPHLTSVERMESVPLHAGELLGATDEAVEFVYFIDDGLVTLIGASSHGHSVEIATVGREGIVGAIACLGHNGLPFDTRVQVSGRARRIRTEILCEEMSSTATPLTTIVLRYLQYEVCQLTQAALCHRFHDSLERLAKWLLLAAQRLPTATVPLTHEAIAHIVGGPRHEVSRDLARLEDAGAVRRGRGTLEVSNLRALRAHACECVERVDGALVRLLDDVVAKAEARP
jgi:CRP-like cAMP-binding protein